MQRDIFVHANDDVEFTLIKLKKNKNIFDFFFITIGVSNSKSMNIYRRELTSFFSLPNKLDFSMNVHELLTVAGICYTHQN